MCHIRSAATRAKPHYAAGGKLQADASQGFWYQNLGFRVPDLESDVDGRDLARALDQVVLVQPLSG